MPHNGGEVQAAERRTRAMELRASGAGYRQIGAALGVSHTQAHKDVRKGLRALHRQLVSQTAEWVALELTRLEQPLVQLANLMRSPDLSIRDRCQVIDTWRKLSESRRKLLGLDEPEKHDHRVVAAIAVQQKAKEYQDMGYEELQEVCRAYLGDV